MAKCDCVLPEAAATDGERIIKQNTTKGINVSENEMPCCGARVLFKKEKGKNVVLRLRCQLVKLFDWVILQSL